MESDKQSTPITTPLKITFNENHGAANEPLNTPVPSQTNASPSISRSSTITMQASQTEDLKHSLAIEKVEESTKIGQNRFLSSTRSDFSTSTLETPAFNAEFIRLPAVIYSETSISAPLSRIHSTADSFSSRTSHIPSRAQSEHFLLAHGRGTRPGQGHGNDLGGALASDESTAHYMAGKSFMGGLIKPPVVRQFLHKGHLYKEEEDRGISHFELFADLVCVAIVHILGEVAAQQASLINAVKFMLMFWPPWSIWADMRSYLNVSGTDDVVQRGYILLSCLLLVGYTAQGASIKVGVPQARVSRLPRSLNHITISEEGYEALRAATAFFLAAKLLRLIVLFSYSWALPRFRTAHLIQAFFTLLPCIIFLRLFFVSEVVDAMEVFVFGVLLDVLGKYMAGLVVHLGATEKNKHQFFIPALEIGHVIEKTAAFFVLVAGEILIAVAYVAHEQSEIGPHGEYLRSCFGVILAYLLCWVYFDADSCKVFVHAIRRHWFSSISWTQLHLPLCGGLVIVAASLHQMIIHNRVDQGLRWYFATGMAVIMFCLGLMGFLHRSLDRPGSGWLPRWFRLGFRIVLGCGFPFFPLYPNESSLLELGFYCAGVALLVLVELVGKIGTVGNTGDVEFHRSGQFAQSEAEGSVGMNHGFAEYVSGEKRFRREELTAYEKGEEDVGGENSVGILKAFSIRRGQRTGLAAF